MNSRMLAIESNAQINKSHTDIVRTASGALVRDCASSLLASLLVGDVDGLKQAVSKRR